MRVAERGITSPMRWSCWHAARDGTPRGVTSATGGGWRGRRTALAAGGGEGGRPWQRGGEDGPGSGRPGTQGSGVREKGARRDAIRDECAARGVRVPGWAARGRAAHRSRAGRASRPSRWPGSTGGGRAGRPPFALAGQHRRGPASAGVRNARIRVNKARSPLRQSRRKPARIVNVCCSGILKG
jgi:hypothetical protein